MCSLSDTSNRHQPTRQGCHAVVVVVSGGDREREGGAEPGLGNTRVPLGRGWHRPQPGVQSLPGCHEPAAHGEGFPLPLPSFALLCTIERQNLTMSALRILVPVKRVIDYAVSPNCQGWLLAVFNSGSSLCPVSITCALDLLLTMPLSDNRSSRASTRRRRASRRPASSTA